MATARAVLSAPGGELLVDEIEVEDPGPDEVAVDLHASGICHTDHDLRAFPGMVLGHEGAGVVMAVGADVRHVAEGDRVVLNWAMPCGQCFQCERGNEHLCELGSPIQRGPKSSARPGSTRHAGKPVSRAFGLGTMSTRTLVQARAVTPLPDDVPFAVGAISACGVMTGVGSVFNAARVQPGDSVVVLGCGGVGLNVLQAARVAGGVPVIAVDISEDRLDTARWFGATETVLARPDDRELLAVAEQIRDRCGGRGADVAFECTAVPRLATAPLAMIRHGGTAIAVSGVEQRVEVDLQLFEFDKTYITPLYGQCSPSRDFPRIFDLYRSGKLLLDELITRTYTIDDAPRAFEDLLAGRNAKGVLILQ